MSGRLPCCKDLLNKIANGFFSSCANSFKKSGLMLSGHGDLFTFSMFRVFNLFLTSSSVNIRSPISYIHSLCGSLGTSPTGSCVSTVE